MTWIVIDEDKGKIKLVSKSNVPGLLPKGSYLTIEEGQTKFILRVDDTTQKASYSPAPMIVDMDLSSLAQDRKCQNIITAYRVLDLSDRTDGFIDYIKPQSLARRSNQEEIDIAMGSTEGPKVFPATIHASQNQLLIDGEGKQITTNLPKDMFFHQMMICGATGSGKTVAMKYLAQYFIEELEGAVLAINVKDVDFLKMDKASETTNSNVIKEWGSIDQKAHGIDNFMVYYPANASIGSTKGVTQEITQKITLDVCTIDPEALTGLLHGITDIAAQSLPNIFRYWQNKNSSKLEEHVSTFNDFVNYFSLGADDKYFYKTLNPRGDESDITLPGGTYGNIKRNLEFAVEFFDNKDAKTINEDDILSPGKMSVIDVAGENGIQFGAILLRHLLRKIVLAKSEQRSKVPILIIIDEVHQFYDSNSSREALSTLNTICRTGRSQEIGVIFASQNPSDIPRGLSTVINTKIFFKSDTALAKSHGVTISPDEMQTLKKGFACGTIHELSQLKILKFPLAFAGVFDGGKNEQR